MTESILRFCISISLAVNLAHKLLHFGANFFDHHAPLKLVNCILILASQADTAAPVCRRLAQECGFLHVFLKSSDWVSEFSKQRPRDRLSRRPHVASRAVRSSSERILASWSEGTQESIRLQSQTSSTAAPC